MAQYRKYTTEILISSTQVVVTTDFGGSTKSDVITVDGSLETNFKTVVNAHRLTATSLPPTSTSPSCTVETVGRWNKTLASGSITSASTVIAVPSGNSGDLLLYRDDGSFTMKYSKNGGAATTFTNGTTLNVANGDTLAFSVTSLAEQEFASGSVRDKDNNSLLDSISFYNTTVVP